MVEESTNDSAVRKRKDSANRALLKLGSSATKPPPLDVTGLATESSWSIRSPQGQAMVRDFLDGKDSKVTHGKTTITTGSGRPLRPTASWAGRAATQPKHQPAAPATSREFRPSTKPKAYSPYLPQPRPHVDSVYTGHATNMLRHINSPVVLHGAIPNLPRPSTSLPSDVQHHLDLRPYTSPVGDLSSPASGSRPGTGGTGSWTVPHSDVVHAAQAAAAYGQPPPSPLSPSYLPSPYAAASRPGTASSAAAGLAAAAAAGGRNSSGGTPQRQQPVVPTLPLASLPYQEPPNQLSANMPTPTSTVSGSQRNSHRQQAQGLPSPSRKTGELLTLIHEGLPLIDTQPWQEPPNLGPTASTAFTPPGLQAHGFGAPVPPPIPHVRGGYAMQRQPADPSLAMATMAAVVAASPRAAAAAASAAAATAAAAQQQQHMYGSSRPVTAPVPGASAVAAGGYMALRDATVHKDRARGSIPTLATAIDTYARRAEVHKAQTRHWKRSGQSPSLGATREFSGTASAGANPPMTPGSSRGVKEAPASGRRSRSMSLKLQAQTVEDWDLILEQTRERLMSQIDDVTTLVKASGNTQHSRPLPGRGGTYSLPASPTARLVLESDTHVHSSGGGPVSPVTAALAALGSGCGAGEVSFELDVKPVLEAAFVEARAAGGIVGGSGSAGGAAVVSISVPQAATLSTSPSPLLARSRSKSPDSRTRSPSPEGRDFGVHAHAGHRHGAGGSNAPHHAEHHAQHRQHKPHALAHAQQQPARLGSEGLGPWEADTTATASGAGAPLPDGPALDAPRSGAGSGSVKSSGAGTGAASPTTDSAAGTSSGLSPLPSVRLVPAISFSTGMYGAAEASSDDDESRPTPSHKMLQLDPQPQSQPQPLAVSTEPSLACTTNPALSNAPSFAFFDADAVKVPVAVAEEKDGGQQGVEEEGSALGRGSGASSPLRAMTTPPPAAGPSQESSQASSLDLSPTSQAVRRSAHTTNGNEGGDATVRGLQSPLGNGSGRSDVLRTPSPDVSFGVRNSGHDGRRANSTSGVPRAPVPSDENGQPLAYLPLVAGQITMVEVEGVGILEGPVGPDLLAPDMASADGAGAPTVGAFARSMSLGMRRSGDGSSGRSFQAHGAEAEAGGATGASAFARSRSLSSMRVRTSFKGNESLALSIPLMPVIDESPFSVPDEPSESANAPGPSPDPTHGSGADGAGSSSEGAPGPASDAGEHEGMAASGAEGTQGLGEASTGEGEGEGEDDDSGPQRTLPRSLSRNVSMTAGPRLSRLSRSTSDNTRDVVADVRPREHTHIRRLMSSGQGAVHLMAISFRSETPRLSRGRIEEGVEEGAEDGEEEGAEEELVAQSIFC